MLDIAGSVWRPTLALMSSLMLAGAPTKHHYLPEFYTRRWAMMDGEMLRYQRKLNGSLEQRRKAPGAIGFGHDLYTDATRRGEDAQLLELQLFRVVDNAAGRIIRDLVNGKVPTDSATRSRWAAFLLSLLARCPEELRALTNAFTSLLGEEGVQANEGELGRQLALQQVWRSIDNPKMGGVLINMEWVVVDFSGCGVSLLTSDFPLVMSNGIRPPEGNYALPLSPNHLFLTHWGGEDQKRVLSFPPRQLAKLCNRLVVERAREFVIAAEPSHQAFIEKRLGTAQVPTPIQSALELIRRGDIG